MKPYSSSGGIGARRTSFRGGQVKGSEERKSHSGVQRRGPVEGLMPKLSEAVDTLWKECINTSSTETFDNILLVINAQRTLYISRRGKCPLAHVCRRRRGGLYGIQLGVQCCSRPISVQSTTETAHRPSREKQIYLHVDLSDCGVSTRPSR